MRLIRYVASSTSDYCTIHMHIISTIEYVTVQGNHFGECCVIRIYSYLRIVVIKVNTVYVLPRVSISLTTIS